MATTRKAKTRMAAFAAGVAALVLSMPSMSVLITGEEWDVRGFDESGGTWNDSTLVFETQDLNAQGDYDLTGYFDWVGTGGVCGSGGCSGRELFEGTLFSDLRLDLSGISLINRVRLALGSYSARVDDASTIVEGRWTGLDDTAAVDGGWSASRGGTLPEVPVPAPGTLALLVLGLACMILARRPVRKSLKA